MNAPTLEDRADLAIERLARRRGCDRPAGDSGDLGDNPRNRAVFDGATSGRPRAILGDSPFAAPEYPVEALGPLAPVARAIADGGQLDIAMAGQVALATAALMTQGLWNVRTLAGVKPLTLYMLTVAESGDGKSTAESVALSKVAETERAEHDLFVAEQARRAADKGDTRPPPITPYRTMKDATAQGIWRAFKDGQPSQGSFTAEAAVMLCGWGMSSEHRAHTAAALNDLWDGSAVSLSRGTDGRTQLYGRRLAVHWLIQPDAARQALHDPLLTTIGYWPRFLVAWPAPLKPRLARQWRPELDPAITAFWSRCAELFREPLLGCDAGTPVIEADAAALTVAKKSFEALEQAARTAGGRLADIRAFAVRATEQAFRVAAVLTAWSGSEEIDANTFRDAVRLVAYSLETWQGIFGSRAEAEVADWARTLLSWLIKQGGRAPEQAILHVGPKSLRSRHRRDAALAALEAAGLIRHAVEHSTAGVERVNRNAWEVTTNGPL